MVGEQHPLARPGRPQVVGNHSIFFRDTERVLGWDIVDTGFKMVLSAGLPDIVRNQLRPEIERFLAGYGLTIGDIACWIAHPGGPKVIQAVEEGLGLPAQALALSRETLARVGNVSSASVLIMLCETLAGPPPDPGTYGLLMAMGPSFGVEVILLQW
jgi:alkylresorcinol/alkylpyrone synthase